MNLDFFVSILIFSAILTTAGVIRREYSGLVIISGAILILVGLFSMASPIVTSATLLTHTASSQKTVSNVTYINESYSYTTTTTPVLSTGNGQDIISLVLVLLGAAMTFGVLFGRRNELT